jgi:NADH-quinone oxidoreductase subunit L
MTHAFFKACLFLGSGSVIHSMEHAEHASGGHRPYTEMQDMRNMGGLLARMPRTAWTFMIATAALSGIPITAGFFSKDEILWKVWSGANGDALLWLVGITAAGMTAFYMGRQVFLTFFGKFRGGEDMESHLHESPGVMTWPLILLAAGSIAAGWVGIPHAFGGGNHIEHFLEPAILAGTHAVVAEAPHGDVSTEWLFALISIAVAGFGLFLAYTFYMKNKELPAKMAASWFGIHRLLNHKYYVDEIYNKIFVRGTLRAADDLDVFDASVVDGVVNGAARGTLVSSVISNLADMGFVDGAVKFVAAVLAAIAKLFRRVQTGLVQNYALLMLVGTFILVAFYYFLY